MRGGWNQTCLTEPHAITATGRIQAKFSLKLKQDRATAGVRKFKWLMSGVTPDRKIRTADEFLTRMFGASDDARCSG